MTNVLAISGNDVFSGGGLYADLNTYTANGLRGFLAVTCLTAMTEKGFEVFATDGQVFKAQLDSLKPVAFGAIKLGLLPNTAIATQALKFIEDHKGVPIVLDPVLVCKEKHDVAVSALRDELLKFFPNITIVTPNLSEAELLAQQEIKTLEDMKSAAKTLHQLGAPTVVIKGGSRLDSERAVDLFYDGEDFRVLDYPVLDKNNVGAGCTFASSIASHLVLGKEIFEAVRISKDFVYQGIQHSDQYGVVQNYEAN
ncbi:bifunctional hydroxymethylpyrimidine kinase/phosphomethylpyrimidine kinase [Streptococcus dentasini]